MSAERSPGSEGVKDELAKIFEPIIAPLINGWNWILEKLTLKKNKHGKK